MALLEINSVTKRYSGHTALDGVSFDVGEGRIHGILGPNGAGKTTLIRIINHITAPDTGEVRIDGHVITQDDVRQIGYMPEERGLFKKMTVWDQAVFFARLKGLSRAEAAARVDEWLGRLGISSWKTKKIEELSKGMAQKIQFVITVLHRPRLLIFDEPFSGFDPINADILKREILALRDEGSTVLFSTHNMASVEELCDDITLINQSHNILTGRVDDIRRQWADGYYRLRYRGAENALHEALAPTGSTAEAVAGEGGAAEARVRLGEGTTLREVIAQLNTAVEIEAIAPERRTMNDIFIGAVSRSQQTEGGQAHE